MNYLKIQRWMGMGLAATALCGLTMAITCRAMAQDQGQGQQRPNRPGQGQFGGQQGQPGQPGGFPGGGGGGFGGGEFGPGGPGGPGGFGPRMGGGGGGASLTANATTVFVLRGNTIYAFDAKTLRQTGKADLPMPEFGPGAPGGPGGPGFPGGQGGGRPGRPGGPGNGGDQNFEQGQLQ